MQFLWEGFYLSKQHAIRHSNMKYDIAITNRAATSTPHCWQLLEYDFSYLNIRPQKKKKKKIPVTLAAAGIVPSVKMFPNSSTVKLTTQKLGPNVRISVWTRRKMDYSAIFGFLKQHIIKSRLQLQLEVKLHVFPATDLGYCSSGKKKNQNSKKFKKKKKSTKL